MRRSSHGSLSRRIHALNARVAGPARHIAGSTRPGVRPFILVTAPAGGMPACGFDRLVRLKAESCPLLSRYRTIVESVIQDAECGRTPGWQAIVEHLVQALLLQTLRALVLQDGLKGTRGARRETTLFKAALDGTIGPALQLIHRRPEEPWTVWHWPAAVTSPNRVLGTSPPLVGNRRCGT